MKRPIKIALGIATLWPFIFILIVYQIFSKAVSPSSPIIVGGPFYILSQHIPYFITMLKGTTGFVVILTFYFIHNVVKNETISRKKKVIWALVVSLGNIFILPFYWYFFIWKEAKES
jgi:hypothetical protein